MKQTLWTDSIYITANDILDFCINNNFELNYEDASNILLLLDKDFDGRLKKTLYFFETN